jgi:Alpha/beta hydrolase domain
MFDLRLKGVGAWVLAACCALTCSLFVLDTPALAAYEAVPTPTVEGPIEVTLTSHPFMATNIPLGEYGYTEEEYFISGTGYTYNTTGAVNVTGTKITTGGPNSDGTYPFKTRIVVRRPTNPANFNGKVVAEWQNVTAGYDLEANWFGDPYYLLRNGYAWVGVSAQNVGVNYLKNTFDPSRYGSLEVGPTGDALSYDIFGAAIKAIRGDGTGPEPLGSLTPDIEQVTASGESQSCGRLATYFNKVAPLHQIVDNYLLTVCTSAIRADRPEKVLRIISEFENKLQQTEQEAPTNPSLRHWEAAGGSHVPFLAAANWEIPTERDVGPPIAYCAHSPVLSRVQWPYLVNVGTKELDEWSKGGSAPPLAARGEYVNPSTLKRNSLGIALGGIRLPDVDVPTGVNLAENSPHAEPNPYPDSAFCLLLGQYQPFSEETLDGLYSDYGDYIDKVKADDEKLVEEGFLLPEDAQRVQDSAEEYPRLAPTEPVLSAASPNTGAFTLTWRGPVPSHARSLVGGFVETHPTFELQHRNSVGEWTTVASSLSEPTYSFASEQEGTWAYRVRSTTVIPGFALEPEEVVVSPWSEVLGSVKVDRSPPNAPSANASREPDYAGGGGWYADEVGVSFSDNGDAALPDGSPGSGVDLATLSPPQSFNTSGMHTACGTVADNLGNVSEPGCLTVQVDATPPDLHIECPTFVGIGAGAQATVTASDGESGLASDPSGSVPIDTSKAGAQTITRTAVDNVGHETNRSCTTMVGYYVYITGPVNGKLVVRAGEAVGLAETAKVNGKVVVKAGGALDVEGATLDGGLSAKQAALVRVCGATINGKLSVKESSGSVVIGEGTPGCSANTVSGKGSLSGNKAGVLVEGNVFQSSLKVTGNSGGVTVTNNKVAGSLTVTGNTGGVVDEPNEVGGKSKLQ